MSCHRDPASSRYMHREGEGPILRTVSRTPEYRIVIPGKAESFRSPNAAQYKRKVAALARRIFHRPCRQEVQFLVDYFHAERRRMDMDNIVKAVMDWVNGI